jgi:hypothetical protein
MEILRFFFSFFSVQTQELALLEGPAAVFWLKSFEFDLSAMVNCRGKWQGVQF